MSAQVNSNDAKAAASSANDEEQLLKQASTRQPFMTIGETSVYFCEDWATGIGGGLWSTGLALARYFTTDHAAACIKSLRKQKGERLSVLELGSGNGFLSVVLLALAHESMENLVVTDNAEHVPMMRETIANNSHILANQANAVEIRVLEHLWGEFQPESSLDTAATDKSDSLTDRVQQGTHQFDLIIGSDLAYRKELYDPLIASLKQYSHGKTVTLIGITMADTTPSFFDRLTKAGLVYEKFAPHLVDPEFRGNTFGVFMIQRRQEED